MKRSLSFISLVSLLLLVYSCYWLGEGFSGFFDHRIILLIIFGSLVVAVMVPVKNNKRRSALYLVLISVLFVINNIGTLVARSAFNECIARGEEVRKRLADHYEANKRYPGSLDELAGYTLPGKRIARPTLLNYSSDGKSYKLYFSDNRVTHEASDSAGFAAGK